MVPRQPPRPNLADPDIVLGTVLCFLSLQALALLPFDQWPDACVLLRVLIVSLSPPDRWPKSAFHVQRSGL